MITKKQILESISEFLIAKLKRAHDNFNEAQESVLNETKGSAGDKHETGRAMAQIEVEKAGKQVREAENNIHLFKHLQAVSSSKVTSGSLVHTDKELFYLAVPLGKIEVSEKTVFCLTIQSPLGQILSGKTSGDCFSFNGMNYEITTIE